MNPRIRAQVNRALRKTLGVELQSSYVGRRGPLPEAERWVPARGARLVPSPVFILCSVRSGSTLLRLMLNEHSAIHAPHELHLRRLHVKQTTREAQLAVKAMDMDHQELEHLLWDRILHRELERSGKPILVEKTPNSAAIWPRLVRSWPEARFIFLLRDPRTTLDSWAESRSGHTPPEQAVHKVVYGMRAVEEARNRLPGLTLRYEDLAADPAAQTRRVCEFLGVPWEKEMLTYGRRERPALIRGVGDWREKIRSGRVQQPRPVTEKSPPPEVRALCATWGYLGGDQRP